MAACESKFEPLEVRLFLTSPLYLWTVIGYFAIDKHCTSAWQPCYVNVRPKCYQVSGNKNAMAAAKLCCYTCIMYPIS